MAFYAIEVLEYLLIYSSQPVLAIILDFVLKIIQFIKVGNDCVLKLKLKVGVYSVILKYFFEGRLISKRFMHLCSKSGIIADTVKLFS